MNDKDQQEIGEFKATLEFIKEAIGEIKTEIRTLKDDFVTQKEFAPVKGIVYGLVTIILLAVVGAIIALVLK